MRILIINCGSRLINELSAATTGLGADIVLLPITDLPLKSVKGFDGIIISGSPLMWSECKNQYLHKFDFIKKAKIPILGVCFGHQTIGLLYGSKIKREKLLKKKIFINFHGKDIIIKGFSAKARFMEYHQEYISLPKGFVLLGTSGYGNIEIIKHHAKPIYGVQFHPEMSGKNGKKILGNFLSLCKPRII